MLTYKPWKGFSLIGCGIVVDILLGTHGYDTRAYGTAAGMIIALLWAAK